MKKQFSILLLTAATALCTYAQEPSSYVNPFIGSSNFGVTHPGPVMPGGMVSMSPFNTIPSPEHSVHTDSWCSTPYVYENKWTIGFTQVNLSGVGCPDLGSLLLMPTSGKLEVDYRKYADTMSNLEAQAGYFATTIGGVRAEMTATTRSTRSRYTFPAGQANILLNIGKGLTTESGCYAKIVSDTEVEGYRLMGDFCYGKPQSVIPIYFVIKVETPSKDIKYWKKQPDLPKVVSQWSSTSGKYKVYDTYKREMAGDEIGVAFSYDAAQGEVIEVSIGVSYVSIENARENLEAEQSGKSFDQLRAEAVEAWNEALGVVSLEGGNEDQKIQFYTALYHNWIHPNVLSDVNGEYPAMISGETLRTSPEDPRLTMFSGWDVYRISPFLGALFYPERQNDMVRSMMKMYQESGNLPKFEIASQEFMVMEGDAALPYLSACYFLGLTKGVPTEELYQAMLKNAMPGSPIRGNNEFYNENYYIPLHGRYDNSVSQALEYYIADWALAQVAKDLGRDEDAKVLEARAMGYKKYFDKDFGLLRPVLADGTFMEGFNPREGENFAPVSGFHEGTSWNYSFAIPYDIKGLIKEFGSSQRFVDSLVSCFENGYFDMGNEPDMGYPYFFSYIKGKEYLTQYWVNNCLERYFSNTPGGLPGNDDAGTMSAWQNLSMMGIYPSCPSKPEYVITTPTFDRVTIELDPNFYDQKELVIEAVNRTPENIYIEKIELDGKPYKSYFIDHATLMKAGRLTIYCSSKPKK
ncbi:MAG: GH92 family glycosyl hydrolase [Rikenellaceae bacterium]